MEARARSEQVKVDGAPAEAQELKEPAEAEAITAKARRLAEAGVLDSIVRMPSPPPSYLCAVRCEELAGSRRAEVAQAEAQARMRRLEAP